MYWTLSLATTLDDAPWPLTKAELLEYGERKGVPMAVMENLQELDDDDMYESILDIWDEYAEWMTLCVEEDED